jgi:hypothetical protein
MEKRKKNQTYVAIRYVRLNRHKTTSWKCWK